MLLINCLHKCNKKLFVFIILFYHCIFLAQKPCLYASICSDEKNDSNIGKNISVKECNCSEKVNNILICSGSNYTFPDGTTFENILTDTSQVSLLENRDSTFLRFITFIKVLPTYHKTIEVNLCEGGNYTFPDGHVYYNIMHDTTYISKVPITVTGCENIVETKIVVKEVEPPRIYFIKEL